MCDNRDIFELRLLGEVPAAAFAATHGDEAFLARLQAETAAMRESSTGHDDEGSTPMIGPSTN